MNESVEFRKKFGEIDITSDGMSQLFNMNSIRNVDDEEYYGQDQDDIPMQTNLNNQNMVNIPKPMVHFQMLGGAKDHPKSLSSSNNYTQASRFEFLKPGMIKRSEPMNINWPMGKLVGETQDGHLQSLVGSLQSMGCFVCHGVGHARTRCQTNNAINEIAKQSPLFRIIIQKTNEWLRGNQQYILEPEWVYAKMLMGFAFQVYRAEGKRLPLMLSFAREICTLELTTCKFCGGYGHFAVQTIDIRLKKRIPHDERDKNDSYYLSKKYVFGDQMQKIEVICGTKLAFERGVMGFSESKKIYQSVVGALPNRPMVIAESGKYVQLKELIEYFKQVNFYEQVSKNDLKIRSIKREQEKTELLKRMDDARKYLMSLEFKVEQKIEEEKEQNDINLPEINDQIHKKKKEDKEKEELAIKLADANLLAQQKKTTEFLAPLLKKMRGIRTTFDCYQNEKKDFDINLFPFFSLRDQVVGNKFLKVVKEVFGELFNNFTGIKTDSPFTETDEPKGIYNLLWFLSNAESPQFASFLFYDQPALTKWGQIYTVLTQQNLANDIIKDKQVKTFLDTPEIKEKLNRANKFETELGKFYSTAPYFPQGLALMKPFGTAKQEKLNQLIADRPFKDIMDEGMDVSE